MNKRTFTQAFVCLALAATQLFAGDVSGKWAMEMAGRDGEKRVQTLTLKTDGDKLTGTMAGRMGEREISNGKLNGDEISFSMTFEMGGEKRTMLYTGKLVGEELKLNVKSEDGSMSRDVVAKRPTS